MTVRVFHHKSLEAIFSGQGLDLAALKADFMHYKTTGVPPNNFGRDAEYNHMNTLLAQRAPGIDLSYPS